MNSAMKTVGVSLAVGTAAAVMSTAAKIVFEKTQDEKGCKKGGKHHK